MGSDTAVGHLLGSCWSCALNAKFVILAGNCTDGALMNVLGALLVSDSVVKTRLHA